MRFFKVTRVDDTPYLINLKHVVAVLPAVKGVHHDDANTVFALVDGKIYAVKETMDQVQKAIVK